MSHHPDLTTAQLDGLTSVACGPGCCAPISGVHASCPGPEAGARVVSAR